MEATTNQQSNVSVGKGVIGGYFRNAPLGTTLPTSYDGEMDPAFKVLGYISDDGITESTDEDTTDVNDMNGSQVLSDQSSYAKTFNLKLIETKAGTLRVYFGAETVTDENGMITVSETAGARVAECYLFDLVLSGNRRERIVVPNGKVTEVGAITYSSGEVLGYEVTITAFPDADGKNTYRYIQSGETSGPDAVESVTLDKATATVAAGSDVTLTATVAPDTAADKTVTAESADTAKATVAVKGDVVTVHGVAATDANKPVTVTVKAGTKTATCAVTVTAPATK